MEGLIPLVYRAIKRTKTRRQYKCLSMTTTTTNYNIADFYSADSLTHQLPYLTTPQEKMVEGFGERGGSDGGHRRYKSVDELGGGGGFYFTPEKSSLPKKDHQVVEMRRFRSHRGIFSCISGG
ncbi:hypothetical protein BVC80_1741g13 [Macleaya cordata]|uniref:Uncharacterized protein n=1 Tax=Macleaya cordata TaxID=56857 RepID=A0A200QKU9_MACCD|nr:hypothetical protein BVC80_1741g13 [Macleaya cordata]